MNKKMKNNELIFSAIFLCVIAFFFAYYGNKMPQNLIKTDTVTVSKTDTVLYTDTFILSKPLPIEVIKTKTDTVFTEKGDTIQLVTENKVYKDTICAQKDTAIVTSYIQGINATLDSVTLRLNRREIIKTNTVTVTKYIEKKKSFTDRFHISPQIGAGYGIINHKPDIYVGVGVSFDID